MKEWDTANLWLAWVFRLLIVPPVAAWDGKLVEGKTCSNPVVVKPLVTMVIIKTVGQVSLF